MNIFDIVVLFLGDSSRVLGRLIYRYNISYSLEIFPINLQSGHFFFVNKLNYVSQNLTLKISILR